MPVLRVDGRRVVVPPGHEPPAPAPKPDPPAVTRGSGVAVVITTCATDAHFVPEALASVAAQTVRPERVVVVDDDGPAEVCLRDLCERHGAEYLRVAHHHCCPARDAGAELAGGRWLLFLDADNNLAPRFVEALLAAARPGDGILYGAGRTMDADGRDTGVYTSVGLVTHDGLRQNNAIDTCALVRREAFEAAGGWGPGGRTRALDDYHLWLRVTGLGWRARFVGSEGGTGYLWHYRRHGRQMTAGNDPCFWQAQRMQTWEETLRLFVVTCFAGRPWNLDRTVRAYQALGTQWARERLHLLAVDNSCDPLFGAGLRRAVSQVCGEWASVAVVRDDVRELDQASPAAFADNADLRVRHEGALARATRRLYAHQVARLLPPAADLVLTLEDDIGDLPPGALHSLLLALEPGVAAVGAYVGRRHTAYESPGPIAWDVLGEDPYRPRALGECAQDCYTRDVGGIAYGCTLWRAQAWRDVCTPELTVNPDGPPTGHDIVFASRLRRAGWKLRLHPGVRVRHYREDGTWA